MDDFHAIVPDGDVDLILHYSEQLGTPVDNVFELDDRLGELGYTEIRDKEEGAPGSPVYEESKLDAKVEEASTATEVDPDFKFKCKRKMRADQSVVRASNSRISIFQAKLEQWDVRKHYSPF